jgi:hypothetical protein
MFMAIKREVVIFWVEEKGLRTEPKREEGEILVLLHLCLNN